MEVQAFLEVKQQEYLSREDMKLQYNIDPLARLLKSAEKCGVKHGAICGSYFAYVAKTIKELERKKWHPYIRSRIDQEEILLRKAAESCC